MLGTLLYSPNTKTPIKVKSFLFFYIPHQPYRIALHPVQCSGLTAPLAKHHGAEARCQQTTTPAGRQPQRQRPPQPQRRQQGCTPSGAATHACSMYKGCRQPPGTWQPLPHPRGGRRRFQRSSARQWWSPPTIRYQSNYGKQSRNPCLS